MIPWAYYDLGPICNSLPTFKVPDRVCKDRCLLSITSLCFFLSFFSPLPHYNKLFSETTSQSQSFLPLAASSIQYLATH